MTKPPFNRFIILGAMRSGSILLEKFLNQYPGLRCYGELFQQSFISELGRQRFLGIDIATRDENPQALLDAVMAHTPDKITGFRFFQDHDKRVMRDALLDPLCAKIILTRDPVASFVSLQIALITRQWLVSDVAHRKQARIHFDLEAYAGYLKRRDAYYDEISATLAATEQPYFEIDYSMLTEVENINRLAAFIGDLTRKTRLHEPIKKQNPGSLASKIINIKEVRAALDHPGLHDREPPGVAPVLESGTDLSRAYFCQNLPMIFGPVPAVPDLGVRKWLARHDGASPQNQFSATRFTQWRKSHDHPVFFSVIRHPVARAYNAFMNKIFSTDPAAYLDIRKDMENQFGMILPQGDISPKHDRRHLERTGYGPEAHRISFKLFLVFVAANLQHQTKIRQDGKWQRQSEIIRRYRILHPEVIVLRDSELYGLRYLENRLNLPPFYDWQNEPGSDYVFPLKEIYDTETESLCQAAYAPDYQEFGYGSYG